MRPSRLLVFVLMCVCVMATSAAAQTKFTGKCNQSKPDPNYVIPVGDKPTHSLMLAKVVCTWAPGAELAGVALKDEIDAFTSEMNGTTSKDHGFGVGTAANGDKYYVRFDGTTTFKGEAPTSATCTWSFTGGTGKLNGLTGKGTCSGTFDATGASVFDIQGEYQLPPPKKGK